MERMRRGSTKPHLINGSLTKIPRDWKASVMQSEEAGLRKDIRCHV